MTSTSESSGVGGSQGLPGSRLIVGEASLRRVGALWFPVWELTNEDEIVARMGRISWWSIYFGYGQKIQLMDGNSWRIRSVEKDGVISALVVNSAGLKVAVGSIASSGYLIDGKDFSYRMFPNRTDSTILANEWTLSSDHAICAAMRRYPTRLTAHIPVSVAAALLAIALSRLGIPGDRQLTLSSAQWNKGL